MPINPEDVKAARQQGRHDAEGLAEHAPPEPLLRVAWADGISDADHLRRAVAAARATGATWQEVGDALDISSHTARNRFNPTGYEGLRRYRQR